MLFCHLLIFIKCHLFEKEIKNTLLVSNCLVGPNLGPKCSQRLSSDHKNRNWLVKISISQL